MSDFKGSTGWLFRFQERHGISSTKLSGERAEVDSTAVHSWKERLSGLLKDYSPNDVYNWDESGLLWRALPTRSMTTKDDDRAGIKISKERITFVLTVNAAGEIEPNFLVIGKHENPRCMKNVNKACLGITYKSNKRAWMTASIHTDYLLKFDANTSHGRTDPRILQIHPIKTKF